MDLSPQKNWKKPSAKRVTREGDHETKRIDVSRSDGGRGEWNSERRARGVTGRTKRETGTAQRLGRRSRVVGFEGRLHSWRAAQPADDHCEDGSGETG